MLRLRIRVRVTVKGERRENRQSIADYQAKATLVIIFYMKYAVHKAGRVHTYTHSVYTHNSQP